LGLAAWRLYDWLSVPTINGLVIAVADGDTLTLQTADQPKLKIRLAEIDTPEMKQPYGLEARLLLNGLVFNQTVQVKTHGLDKYRRTLGRVYVNGLDVNAELVKQGAAWVYVQYASDVRLFALEQQARAAQRGLWALPEAQRIAPWEWRHNKNLRSEPVRIEAPAGTCGNKRTCKDMISCEEARFYLTQCGLSYLDKNGDGVPCEKLCC
jgi:endonuclease YncB( thermonuclease family)